jgi:hypothetical protein
MKQKNSHIQPLHHTLDLYVQYHNKSEEHNPQILDNMKQTNINGLWHLEATFMKTKSQNNQRQIATWNNQMVDNTDSATIYHRLKFSMYT